MKLSLENNQKHGVAVTTKRDDLTIYELADYLYGLLIGYGFTEESVNEILNSSFSKPSLKRRRDKRLYFPY